MIEIKNIPKDWEQKKLEDICERITKGATPTTYGFAYVTAGVNFIKVENIENGMVNTSRISNFITQEAHKFQNRSILKEDDLLFSIAGTIGETCLIKKEYLPANTNQALAILRGYKTSILPILLTMQLNSRLKSLLKSKARGGAMNNISLEDLKNIPIILPPTDVQKIIVSKIEELFSELDKSIENLRTAQQQLKTYRQAVLKWAFEGKLTEEWRKLLGARVQLPPGTPAERSRVRDPSSLQEENGGLPEGWRIAELQELCEIKRGKSKHRPRNEPFLFGGKYPFIQTGDIRNANGGYITTYSQSYSEAGLQQSKLWSKGTLCITIAANIGETAILGLDACFPDSVVGLICNEDKLLIKYANYFFISHKSKLEELAPATAQKNINVDILEKVKIPIPANEEQHAIIGEIESRLSVTDKLEETITQSLQQAEALRQSILKKAFEGRLV